VAKTVQLTIETFFTQHPAMNGDLLVEPARAALVKHHTSPASFQLHHGPKTHSAKVNFEEPDPRSSNTLEREDIVEKGAIVMAGLLLTRFQKKQITRVMARGSRVDYFVGEKPGDFRWILEVSGTDSGNINSLRGQKREQLLESHYRQPPHLKDGFVAVTRFAPQATSILELVPASA
jgi:hypothetical protein